MKWIRWKTSLKNTATWCIKHHVKYNQSGSSAGMIRKKTNCAGYVCEALYRINVMPKGSNFWCGKTLHANSKAQKAFKKYFYVAHPKRTPKHANLKKGDICGFQWGSARSNKCHTMVYAGMSKHGYPLWYTYGANTAFSTNARRKKSYESKKIYVRIRFKNMD